jgi:small subunit ribosomal protein S2
MTTNVIPMKALLESGVHFGHRTNKWNPAMKPYIFTERNSIHIIDLQQTVKNLNAAYKFVVDTVSQGGTVLFVGTKRQAQETVMEEAIRCGMPYVTERWLGGMLTNWVTIQKRVTELERLEKIHSSPETERLTKKELLLINREINRLNVRLGGVRNMRKLPSVIFVVDISREATAIHEANLQDIPVVAMVDTNCDPSKVDYVIPSNDDAIRAIKLIVGKIADGVLEGMALRKELGADETALPEKDLIPSSLSHRLDVYQEVEVEDEELLGESTLAKLVVKPVDEEEREVSVEEEVVIAKEEDDKSGQ